MPRDPNNEGDDDLGDFDDPGPPPAAPVPSSWASWRILTYVFITVTTLAVFIVLAVIYSRVAELREKLNG